AGVAILPGVREAVFENDGEKSVVVKEGQEIEGWTVASIHSDQVLLKSAQGEQVVKPADGVGKRRLAGARTRRPSGPAQAQARTAGPVIPARTGAVPAGATAGPVRQPGRPAAPAAPAPQRLAPARIGR